MRKAVSTIAALLGLALFPHSLRAGWCVETCSGAQHIGYPPQQCIFKTRPDAQAYADSQNVANHSPGCFTVDPKGTDDSNAGDSGSGGGNNALVHDSTQAVIYGIQNNNQQAVGLGAIGLGFSLLQQMGQAGDAQRAKEAQEAQIRAQQAAAEKLRRQQEEEKRVEAEKQDILNQSKTLPDQGPNDLQPKSLGDESASPAGNGPKALPEETYSSSLTLTVADNVVLKAVLSGGKYIITLTNNNNYPVDVNVYMSVDDNCSHSFSDETLMPSQTVKAGWVQPLGTNWFFKPGIVVRDHVSDGFNYGPSRNPANHNP